MEENRQWLDIAPQITTILLTHKGKDAHCREAWDNNEYRKERPKAAHPNPTYTRDASNRKARKNWGRFSLIHFLKNKTENGSRQSASGNRGGQERCAGQLFMDHLVVLN